MLTAKILIADDEPLCCRLLAGILRREGFRNFQFAEGGRSALELIDTYRPDLVLLDMQMPDLDGLEVCKRIRAQSEFVDVPILVQTATIERKGMGVLFEAGATDFLSKPINPSELVSRVSVHLERRKLLRELRQYRERTSQELDAAQRMQFELMPPTQILQELAASAGLRIGSYARPSSEIGGDLWGVLPIDPSSFGVFLADFAGHGVTAALNTFRLHALIHEHKNLHGDPSGLLAMLNERLVGVLPPGQFATFLYAVIQPAEDRIRFASAGAPSPIVARGHGAGAVIVEACGVPLGVVRGTEYPLHQYALLPDSSLLLYSDGLSEFPHPNGHRIGDEGLRQLLDCCHHGLTPYQVIDRVCDAAGFGTEDALPDDVTVICIDRHSAAAALACEACESRLAALRCVSSPDVRDFAMLAGDGI